ncbi:hypothetical protein GCM10009779_00200 [Polymorphospora rubra]|uniref:Uncharacterized protein n=1 Tax=Polymorphospora rubra TaxID=338584 RepID=A0A810N5X3_9ACTN|nr:hypothetical protein [Polymorphospora rubra]BCJ68697.1 hypothetical protein Prubr_57180 [Polymorphospora rubra]
MLGIGAVVALGLGGLWLVLAPYYGTILVWELRGGLPLFAALAVAVATYLAARTLASSLYGGYRTGVALLAGVLGLAGGGWWMLHTFYEQDRTYLAEVEVVDAAVPGLEPRAPYQVGVAQARPNLGDTTGEIAGTSYLPGVDRFATLVDRRGWLAGYEVAFTQQIPLQGRGATDQKCQFDREHATRRVSGWFGHNLGRQISSERRWVRFDGDDVYAYCDGDRPVVVVPLKRQVGVWVVVEKPAGVALYDGATGALTFTTDTAGIPGPSYPSSIAGWQRESTGAMGSFADWFFGRVGWQVPDDGTNAGNDAEFTLATADGRRPVYVTPMAGRGSATAISVVSVVPARHAGLGLAPVTVHRLDPVWVSPGAIVDRIRADYQDIPNWVNINVYEVVPTGGDGWAATLGTGQNILYRASGAGDLSGDKATCLQRADGSEIRCGSVADRDGRGPGGAYGDAGAPGGGGVPSGDLGGLTDAELAELHRRVADEVACRLAGTCGRN